MNAGAHVFLYCERGTSEDWLAEPFNAASNAVFLIAALAALWLHLRRPPGMRNADHPLMIALVFLIGLGSLAFHLLADQSSQLADVVPIDLFMAVYLGFALNRLLGVPPGWSVLLLVAFAGVVGFTMQLRCFDGAIGIPGAETLNAKPCLNGSLFYLPALGAMAVIGGLLAERHHPAARYILWAALVFAVSVTFRSLDLALCDAAQFHGRKIGTHFLWHVLNGLTLFLLLRASFEAGAESPRRLLPRPEATANPD